MRSRLRIVAVVAVVGIALAGAGLAAGQSSGGADRALSTTASASSANTSAALPTLHVTQRLGLLPEEPGEIRVIHEFDVPSSVSTLEVGLNGRMTLVDAHGFTRVNTSTLRWDGNTTESRLTYHAAVDRTVERDDPIGAGGVYLFKDAGDWALIQRPQLSYRWEWGGAERIRLRTSSETIGPGYTSDAIAFLGPHERHSREAHGQQFVLVEPDAADLSPDPTEILDLLAAAGDRLRVGDRDAQVVVIAAPTGEVDWGLRGAQIGPADAWVRDLEPLADPLNVWLHEYVHTRQGFTTATSAHWLKEATANYYATLLALQTGYISYSAFRATLDEGTDDRFRSARLSNPATWDHEPEYSVGPLVAAALDREIRQHQDAGAAFADVLAEFNRNPERVDHAAVVAAIDRVGGPTVADLADQYLTTTERPSTWTASHHSDVFSPEPPRFAFRLADAEPVRIHGPYRNETAGSARPIRIVPDEKLSVPVAIENRGDVTGEYRAPPAPAGMTVEPVSGSLAAGETDRQRVSVGFDGVGPRTLSIDEVAVPVEVHSPARPAIRGWDVQPREVVSGDAVTVRLELHNAGPVPGERRIGVIANEAPVVQETVRMAPGDTRELEWSVPLNTTGTVQFTVERADLAPVTVDVRSGADRDGQVGLGVFATLVAIAIVGGGYVVRLAIAQRP